MFEDITQEEILTEIRCLNNRKSSDNGNNGKSSDNGNISVNILKLNNGIIFLPILSQIFNEYIKRSIFCSVLKTARIIPLDKKGDESNLLNYRPISILTHLSKYFEKILNRRLIYFVQRKI